MVTSAMKKSRYLTLLWLCAFLNVPGFGLGCPYKECMCEGIAVFCVNRGLNSVPQLVSTNNGGIMDVMFDGNQITAIPSRSLPANISNISIMENPLTTIDNDAFDESVNTLETLGFSNVNFTRIPDSFLHLNVLRYLTISDSVIHDWNMDAMKHLGSTLEGLLIENVALNGWPSWLQHYSNLTELTLTGASIADIPDDALNLVANTLTILVLSNNSLTVVPRAVYKLSALESLSLQHNKISDAKWLPQFTKLAFLTLNNNKLYNATQLTTILRPHADALVTFSIQDNLLTAIPNMDFLTRVDSLDFSNNRLVDPNSGSLPPGLRELKMGRNTLPRIPRILSSLQYVTELFLGSNAITEIEGIAFPPFTRGVEFEFNLITEITDTSFPVNSSITYVLLNNNPLVKISNNAFRNLPYLVELNLQNTKLTRLPLALAYLGKIDSFDISGTESLVCTCLEKSLQEWIRSLAADEVKGNCGRASIYYFYTILSSECP